MSISRNSNSMQANPGTPAPFEDSALRTQTPSQNTPREQTRDNSFSKNVNGTTEEKEQQNPVLGVSLIPQLNPTIPSLLEENAALRRELAEKKTELHNALMTIQALKKSARVWNHEIRNMMVVVGANADDISTAPNPDHIRRASRSLKKVADEVVRTSTFYLDEDKRQINEAPLHLKQYLEEALEDSKTVAKEKYKKPHLKFELEMKSPELWVMSNLDALKRIFPNLLSNAVKFTDAGSISIIVETISQDAQKCKLSISVQDSGSGMPPEKAQSLFLNRNQENSPVYNQVHDTNKIKVGGSGLGLGIAHDNILNILKGEVSVDSKPGQGTTITITATFNIPTAEQILASQQQTTSPAPSEPMPNQSLRPSSRASQLPQSRLNVLIVDDELVNRKTLAKTIQLTGLGYTCHFALNGQDALNKFRLSKTSGNLPYTLIFMDLTMPIMDGLEATKAIKAEQDPLRPCPIYILSADSFAETRDTAMNAGATGYLTKPSKIEDLRPVLEKFIDQPNSPVPLAPTAPSRPISASKSSLFKKNNKVAPLPAHLIPPSTPASVDGQTSNSSQSNAQAIESSEIPLMVGTSNNISSEGDREKSTNTPNTAPAPSTAAVNVVPAVSGNNKLKKSFSCSIADCLPSPFRRK